MIYYLVSIYIIYFIFITKRKIKICFEFFNLLNFTFLFDTFIFKFLTCVNSNKCNKCLFS